MTCLYLGDIPLSHDRNGNKSILMALSEIRLYFPHSVQEALKLFAELEEALYIAGGTDLLVNIKKGLIEKRDLISLQRIKELQRIEKEGRDIRIGGTATLQEIIFHPLIKQHIPALASTAQTMASSQIRSLATVGGNIISAVPSADLPPCLISAGAAVELQSGRSSRVISLSEFFLGPRRTACLPGEILTSVHLPFPPPRTGMAYQKFTLREANALAVTGVASRLTLKNNRIEEAAVVLGAVAPTPVLAFKASEFLCGKRPSKRLFKKAALLARDEGSPISDMRGSIWFRKELIRVLTCRALNEALRRAQGESREGA